MQLLVVCGTRQGHSRCMHASGRDWQTGAVQCAPRMSPSMHSICDRLIGGATCTCTSCLVDIVTCLKVRSASWRKRQSDRDLDDPPPDLIWSEPCVNRRGRGQDLAHSPSSDRVVRMRKDAPELTMTEGQPLLSRGLQSVLLLLQENNISSVPSLRRDGTQHHHDAADMPPSQRSDGA
jgi:hypothetical protein